MKKLISILLALALLCALLSGCKSKPKETNELWVLTDLGKGWRGTQSSYDGAQEGQQELESLVKYYGGLPSDLNIRVEVLPKDDADLHSRLVRLKTEMMTGGGPDVFVLTCDQPGIYTNQERLFFSVENAMERDFFLPLDNYIENARFMEWDRMNQVVRDAGRTEKGQMVLPAFHHPLFGYVLSEGDARPTQFPNSWQEALEWPDQRVREAYSYALWGRGFRCFMFEQTADYAEEEMVLSQEDLLAYTREALSLDPDPRQCTNENVDNIGAIMNMETSQYLLHIGEHDPEAWFPVRNVEGGVTSQIVSYMAINRNTSHPDEAFVLVDMMMSRSFLSCSPFWDFSRTEQDSVTALWDGLRGWGGIPVYDDFFDEGGQLISTVVIPISRQPVHRAVMDEISYAYFPSNVDMEMENMFVEYMEAESDAEVEKIVKKAYTTMKMMLAES